ncbi:hypothetical protein EAH89_15670 [Roseomonas nepalensis]|uniref:DUF5710 domain-containing protein n=1 Tax=Muricoccus nepalensis TaxID=1854500 RepID=A0A502FVZ5_9PROT|nr:AAA domain-containing protein [Roseomonas nepalensis]TPG53644.1 hypothetical protein EAH89_15670 [Roseomonas nepalensis]
MKSDPGASAPVPDASRGAKRSYSPKPFPPPRSDGGLWLRVDYEERDLAKSAGARWDPTAKFWYAPPSADDLRLMPWMPLPGRVARKALGAGKIVGYWRNAIGIEDLDALLKEDPVGDDIPLQVPTPLPDALPIDVHDPKPFMLLIGRTEPPARVLLAIPFGIEPIHDRRAWGRLTIPEEALPRLNDRLLDRPGALANDSFIGQSDEAESWNRDQLQAETTADVQEWIRRGINLLSVVSRCDPLSSDLTEAPGAMGGRTPLVARLVQYHDKSGAAQGIAETYDRILQYQLGAPLPGLMDRWTEKAGQPLAPLGVESLMAAADAHLGHMDSPDDTDRSRRKCYPLDPSQREAVLTTSVSDIMAVQGPPGTGKTSMMKGVVASAIVAPLLREEAMPGPAFILATAATNKAVTNVIDGFGDIAAEFAMNGLLHARWLRGVRSFGWFSPRAQIVTACQAVAAALKPGGKPALKQHQDIAAEWGRFQILARRTAPQNAPPPIPEYLGAASGLLAHGLGKAEEEWLACFGVYTGLGGLSVDQAAAELRKRVREVAKAQRDARQALRFILPLLSEAARQRGECRPGDVGAEARLPQVQSDAVLLRDDMAAWQKRVDGLQEADRTLNRGGIFGWFARLTGQRAKAVRLVWDAHIEMPETEGGADDPARLAPELLTQARAKLVEATGKLVAGRAEVARLQAAADRWRAYQAALDRLNACKRPVIAAVRAAISIRRAPGASPISVDALTEILNGTELVTPSQVFHAFEDLMDLGPRVIAFHLAARYWEARHLMWHRERTSSPSGPVFEPGKALRAEIDGALMIAPCVVATAHRIPRVAMVMRNPVNGMAWGVADLLIIDEAGQAQPEIVSAALAYTRRALVVGDILQLEPVWSETAARDDLLRRACRLKGVPLEIAEGPGSVSRGSAMLLANRASMHEPVMLSRHYRCLPAIIEWCNKEVYGGRMIPVRQPEPDNHMMPVAHVAVAGQIERPREGSLHNRAEAAAVVDWIRKNETAIRSVSRGKPLGRSLVVITPYRAHARLLEQSIRKVLSSAEFDGMVIGTVHRLQGAEAPVVLFSIGATDPGSTAFLDEKPNLLNVAVSRAKESFVVFAHPKMLARSDDRPVGSLARWVAAYPFID